LFISLFGLTFIAALAAVRLSASSLNLSAWLTVFQAEQWFADL
jgi:hypothetical protein